MNKEESLYDPLEVARASGLTDGIGLSGKYQKNLVTRIGFILVD